MSNNGSSDGAALRNIYECIRKAAGLSGVKPAEVVTGIVKTVNEADRSCTAELVYGETALTVGAMLSPENNDGFILIPAIESTVHIVIMPDNTCFVARWSDIDKVICYIDGSNKFEFDSNGFILNGGLNGGLINIVQLTTELNKIVTNVNANYALLVTAISALGGAYAPTVAVPLVKTAYEDLKVKH